MEGLCEYVLEEQRSRPSSSSRISAMRSSVTTGVELLARRVSSRGQLMAARVFDVPVIGSGQRRSSRFSGDGVRRRCTRRRFAGGRPELVASRAQRVEGKRDRVVYCQRPTLFPRFRKCGVIELRPDRS